MKKILFILPLIFLMACAPQVQHIEFDQGRKTFGPSQQDIDLMSLPRTHEMSEPKIKWSHNVISEADFDRWQESSLVIAKLTGSEALKGQTNNIFQQLQILRSNKLEKFSDGFYTEMIIQESKDLAKTRIDTTLDLVKSDLKIFLNLLQELSTPLTSEQLKNAAQIELFTSVSYVQSYLQKLIIRIQSIDFYPAVKQALSDEINKQKQHIEELAQQKIPLIQKTKKLSEILQIASETITSEQLSLDTDSQKNLTQGLKLSKMIDSYKDAQGALGTLIEVWKMLDPKQRELFIKPASTKLYDFLKNQDDSDLKCLQNPSCHNLFKILARSMFILPAIKDYGLEKLRNTLNTQSRDFALLQIQRAVAEEAYKLPATIANLAAVEFTRRISQAEKIKNNLSLEIKDRFHQMMLSILPESQGQTSKSQSYSLQLDKVSGSPSALVTLSESTSEDLATSFGLSAHYLHAAQYLNESEKKLALEKINNIAEIYLNQKEVNHQKFSQLPIRTQAEWIRGISQWTRVYRDWQKDEFNKIFDPLSAINLFPEFNIDDLKQSLFPKEAIFALGLSAVAEGLRTITQAPSPFFLIDTDNQMTWIDQYNMNNSNSTSQAVMVGVVDQSSGSKSNFVKSEDISRYIIALSEFLNTIEDIEKTNSTFLTRTRDQKISALQEIMKNKINFKLLILGLSNYLSHQLKDSDGLIISVQNIDSGKPALNSKNLMDQALALRALIAASNILKIDLYKWEAEDLYISMNKKLFNADLQFYSTSNQKVELPDVFTLTETMRGLHELKFSLNEKSQKQIMWISEPWIQKISQSYIQLRL